MPETDTLDLTALDLTEAAWDELTCAMLDGEAAQFDGPQDDCAASCSCTPECGWPGSSCNL